MKRGMAAVLIILLTFAVLIAAGTLFLLYRHFVTNRIMDGGRMENPDAQRDDKADADDGDHERPRRLPRLKEIAVHAVLHAEDEQPHRADAHSD